MKSIAILVYAIVLLVFADDLTRITHHSLAHRNVNTKDDEAWKRSAIRKMWFERWLLGNTPLKKITIRGFPYLDILLKNETASPSESLKHRFSWALFMYLIVEGKIRNGTHLYESTSGNTGAGEAYLSRSLGLPYTAIVSTTIEDEKLARITKFGGNFIKVASNRLEFAREEAKRNHGLFLDQDSNGHRASEYHETGGFLFESSNVFHEVLKQLKEDRRQVKKIPDYFIQSAGVGGTISSIGRYAARYSIPTRVVLADPEFSPYYDYVLHDRFTNESTNAYALPPGIPGVGVKEPVIFGKTTSLVRSILHEVIKIPDIASAAAMQVLRRRGYDVGPSTALNILAILLKAFQLRNKKVSGRLTIATIVGDPGHFYVSSFFNETWLEEMFKTRGGLKAIRCWEFVIDKCWNTGSNFLAEGLEACSP